jgi:hypothetical protein
MMKPSLITCILKKSSSKSDHWSKSYIVFKRTTFFPTRAIYPSFTGSNLKSREKSHNSLQSLILTFWIDNIPWHSGEKNTFCGFTRERGHFGHEFLNNPFDISKTILEKDDPYKGPSIPPIGFKIPEKSIFYN